MDALVRQFPLEKATTALDVLSEEGVSSFAKLCSSKDLHFPISKGIADSLVDFLTGLHTKSSSNTLLVDDFFVSLYAESSIDNQSTRLEVDSKGLTLGFPLTSS